MFYPWLSGLYGQLRGYDRLRIRGEAARHAGLSAGDLSDLGLRLFGERVRDAIARFPTYAEKVRAWTGVLPDGEGKIRPETLPVWTRDDQKGLFGGLNAPPVAGAFVHSTGGSTGVPSRFYVTRKSYEWRTAVSDRGYSWAGADPGHRSFFVWGAPVHALSVWRTLKTALHHRLQRRRLFDSFSFDDARKAECCRQINRFRPQAIVGYAGNLVELAVFVRENPGILPWKARSVVTAAEGLQPGQRELIEQFMGDTVFMSYGSREFMLIGMECRRRRGYHVASDNVLVEVVDDMGRPLRSGERGKILATDLRNAANPFIRYEIGDSGSLSDGPCDCGLPFPLLASVDGRGQEFIETPGGDRMTALFIPHLMKEFPWADAYQVVQKSADEVTICLITERSLARPLTDPIERALRERLGPRVRIAFEKARTLHRNAAGKTPIVVRAGILAGSASGEGRNRSSGKQEPGS